MHMWHIRKFIVVIIFIGVAVFLFMYYREEASDWYVSPDSMLIYPEERGSIDFTKTLIEDNQTYTIEKVVYKSRGKDIYGLLYIPKQQGPFKAVIDLPAAGATKESYHQIAKLIADNGYAYFVIDQRGIGETGGLVPSTQQDYDDFIANREPFQHLAIYDALKAFDFMRRQDKIDTENIAIMGESMGGRTALVAGSMDSRVKAVIGYSTSGYQTLFGQGSTFIKSFNPNTYVQNISPRKFVMFHSKWDSVIPFIEAQHTFGLANGPKQFVVLPDKCSHGFCFYANDLFINELNELFG